MEELTTGVNETAAAEQTTETTQTTETSTEQSTETVDTGVKIEQTAAEPDKVEKAFAARLKDATAKEREKARDELIAEMYGESHGIKTYADYQKALEQQKEEQHLEEMKAKGVDPNAVKEYAEELPEVKEAKQMKRDRENMKALQEIAPHITDASMIPTEVLQEYIKGKGLAEAYAVWKLKDGLQAEAKAKAEAAAAETKAKANETNAASSMGSVGSNGETDPGFITKEMFEAKKNDRTWVIKNLTKISESRTKW